MPIPSCLFAWRGVKLCNCNNRFFGRSNLYSKVFMRSRIKKQFLLPVLMAVLGLMSAGQMKAQTFTTLHSFTQYIDGDSLQARLVLSGNILYGTTEYGGKYDTSTLFAINTDGTDFRTVYNFSAKAPNS